MLGVPVVSRTRLFEDGCIYVLGDFFVAVLWRNIMHRVQPGSVFEIAVRLFRRRCQINFSLFILNFIFKLTFFGIIIDIEGCELIRLFYEVLNQITVLPVQTRVW